MFQDVRNKAKRYFLHLEFYMRRKEIIMKKENQLKKATIIARCTEDEKNQILKHANKVSKSESRYILDCAIAGTERKTDILKKVNVSLIELQEQMNQLSYLVRDNKENITEDVSEQLLNKIKLMEANLLCRF